MPMRRSGVEGWGVGAGLAISALLVVAAAGRIAGAQEGVALTNEPAAVEQPPVSMSLSFGELRSIPIEGLSRVAVGNPHIADVTIMSETELLLHAKQIGATSLIIWDRQGKREIALTIVDVGAEETARQLERLLSQFGFGGVRLKREGQKLFLIGSVPTDRDLERLQELSVSFAGVTNLVSVPPDLPKAEEPPPGLVRLSVQVLELDRSFTEKIGVKWNETIGITETPPVAARRFGDMLKIGQLSRTGFTQTVNFLVQQGKGRVLAEPVLVTASGKQASSFMGQSIPVISSTTTGVTTGGVASNVEFRDVGVKLTMTPTILTAFDKISTILEAEVSSVDSTNSIQIGSGNTTTNIPGFKTRRAQTEVVTQSGETIIIAGLLQLDESENVSQLPAVGSIPVLGRLFRSPEYRDKRTELVLAVTPELLDAGGSQPIERTMSLDRALATVEGAPAREDPRLQYALQVQERIARALRYPMSEKERKVEGRVKLRLHLFSDGTLARAVVAESSGIDALDTEALKAAENQAPYPRFPSRLIQRDLWVEVPVIFRL
jgi:pilus assembly protein CpaC